MCGHFATTLIIKWRGASFNGQAPRWYPRFTLGDLFATTLIVKWPGASFNGQAPRWYPLICRVPYQKIKKKKKKNRRGHTLVSVETLVKERKEVAYRQERCEDATHRLHIAEQELKDLEGHNSDDGDDLKKRPLFGPHHRGRSPGKGRTQKNRKHARL